MQLGLYNLSKPVILAPMAGITDKAFREIVFLVGGKYAVTEMISSKALVYNNSKTIEMIDLKGEREPCIVQIFGSEPDSMAQAAKLAVEYGANVIDINMGCPTPKIVRNGEGAALLRNIPLAEKIAQTVVRAVNVPVTVKMRLGWDNTTIIAQELALRLEAVGISMLTVHARTREQYYAGRANWEWLGRIKEKVRIPIIGNGDIVKPEDALSMINATGCDGVMIGRAAQGNPWLIGRTQHYLETGELVPEPTRGQKLKVLLLHFEKVISYKGERVGVNEIRKHASWYIKGIRNATEYRTEIMNTDNYNTMKAIIIEIYSEIVSESD